MKSTKTIVFIFFFVIAIIIGFFLYRYYQESKGRIDVDFVYNSISNEDGAVQSIVKQFPNEVKDMNVGLPPHVFYSFKQGKKAIVIYTSEGSGVATIFAATCFDVTNNNKIEILGKYEYKPIDSYLLTDIKNLNPTNCKILGM